jgi:hypothetical protein
MGVPGTAVEGRLASAGRVSLKCAWGGALASQNVRFMSREAEEGASSVVAVAAAAAAAEVVVVATVPREERVR